MSVTEFKVTQNFIQRLDSKPVPRTSVVESNLKTVVQLDNHAARLRVLVYESIQRRVATQTSRSHILSLTHRV